MTIALLQKNVKRENQRVICLSVTSETRYDTRDQRESLRGGAPRTKSGQIFTNFGKFWKILGKICTSQTFNKVNTKKCFSIKYDFVVFPCIIVESIFEAI